MKSEAFNENESYEKFKKIFIEQAETCVRKVEEDNEISFDMRRFAKDLLVHTSKIKRSRIENFPLIQHPINQMTLVLCCVVKTSVAKSTHVDFLKLKIFHHDDKSKGACEDVVGEVGGVWQGWNNLNIKQRKQHLLNEAYFI